MSELKDKAKQLKDISKKYGYEMKYTHALEIVSQLELNVNRHVALKNEKNKSQNFLFDFSLAPIVLETHIRIDQRTIYVWEPRVVKITCSDDLDYIVVLDESVLDMSLFEDSFPELIQSISFLTKEEIEKKGLNYRFEGEDDLVPFNSFAEWILDQQKHTEEFAFVLTEPEKYRKA